ncbi:hypothetical protein [Mycolicibacterium sp.]|uniref:hypothetical protein n=1 Tax=Mycolicibacterium sp. TaxID=2320850 RepID=UPI001DE73BFE|nr:hypothetical protein [Mycolicibacterium sp.]MCB1291663.1 hypothetical protein [Mycobacterium sp.]MCB9408014.1 hypothetical protein [Mycolicibacterium sp.]
MTAWHGLGGAVQSRRLSRRFGTVVVDISSARLRQITAVGFAGEQERIDLGFALMRTILFAGTATDPAEPAAG